MIKRGYERAFPLLDMNYSQVARIDSSEPISDKRAKQRFIGKTLLMRFTRR